MVINKRDKKTSLLLEDLASLEAYIRDVFTFSPLPLCFISPLGVILESNPAFEKISNFSFDEIIGKAIEKVFDKEEIQKLARDTLGQGFAEGREMKFFPKAKTEIAVQVFTRARKDEKGKTVGYFLSLFDLTELKEARSTLEIRVKARTKELRELAASLEERVEERTKGLVQSREALMNMLEDVEKARSRVEEEKNKTLAVITNFVDGLLVFDKENNLASINPRAEDFLRIKEKDITGKSISELSKVAILKPLTELYKKKTKKVFREELKISEDLILEMSTVPLIREKKGLGTLVILHDVTREKLIEKMKTEFVSLSAHQLRTPLSAIKWTTKMILDEELGKINEEQREFLQDSYNANERMIALINNLLNVARIEEGRYIFKPILANIEEITKDVIDSYKEETKRRGLKIEFKKPKKKLPRIILDIEKMQIAIDNLVRNAIRYTLRDGRVTVSLKCDKEKIEFSVKDSGVGILKQQQKRIFTKFFRGTNVMRMDTEGAGLGLFITKNIIEAHGGRIWFESELEKGTTFYFTIPIKKK